MSHTPGPWRILTPYYFDDDGYREIAIQADVKGVTCTPAAVCLQFPKYGGMQEANARLIAAAPTMLEALEAAYVYALQTDGILRVRQQGVFCALRDAIVAATGRDTEEVQTTYEAIAAHFKTELPSQGSHCTHGHSNLFERCPECAK